MTSLTMTDDVAAKEGLTLMESEMHRIVAGDTTIYDCGWNIWRRAFSLAPKSPDIIWPLWLIWGALTDWAEDRPNEIDEAERAMLRAAKEWLAIDSENELSRKAYLDRWVYEECGYDHSYEIHDQ